MCILCIVRFENRITRFFFTRTISLVFFSYFLVIILIWLFILKCFFSLWDINFSGSRRFSCLGIMVILLSFILIILFWRWINFFLYIFITFFGIRLWFIFFCCFFGIIVRSKRLFIYDKYFFFNLYFLIENVCFLWIMCLWCLFC